MKTTITPEISNALLEEVMPILLKHGVATEFSFLKLETDRVILAYDRVNCTPPCRWAYIDDTDNCGVVSLTRTCLCPGDDGY